MLQFCQYGAQTVTIGYSMIAVLSLLAVGMGYLTSMLLREKYK